jgi:hypothetical protein
LAIHLGESVAAGEHLGRLSDDSDVLIEGHAFQSDAETLFRWFLEMSPVEAAFDPTVFTDNRPRMDLFGITGAFFDAVLAQAISAGLCSDDHFSVDGTIIENYASMKSFRPHDDSQDDNSGDPNSFKPRNPDADFHGKKRRNRTHAAGTNPDAKRYRKGPGKPSQLANLGHVSD